MSLAPLGNVLYGSVMSTHCMVVELRSVDTLTIVNVADESLSIGVALLRFKFSSRVPFKSHLAPMRRWSSSVRRQVKVAGAVVATTYVDGDSIATNIMVKSVLIIIIIITRLAVDTI